VSLPPGILVTADALASLGSYEHVMARRSHLREVLHVQCMSEWAPMCIGPYSQANIVKDSIIFVAGNAPSLMKVMIVMIGMMIYNDVYHLT
jgi:diphthine-ammonia ligase